VLLQITQLKWQYTTKQ